MHVGARIDFELMTHIAYNYYLDVMGVLAKSFLEAAF